MIDDLEEFELEEALGFNTLHAIALSRVALDRRSGVPLEGICWMVYQWLADLVTYARGSVDPNIVREVMLALEDDEVLSRDLAGQKALDVLLNIC